MGWEEHLFALFDDLEQQAEALFDAEREVELADRSRAEYHHVSLASRLMAPLDREVVLDLLGGATVTGTLVRLGTGWCLVRGQAQDWVVRSAAVVAVSGARTVGARGGLAGGHQARPRVGPEPARRVGERCVLQLVDGGRREAVLRRVGADFVEAEVGEDAQRGVLVAFTALAAVQSRD